MYFIWQLNIVGQARPAKIEDIYGLDGQVFRSIVQYHELDKSQRLLSIQELMDLFPYNPKNAA